MKEILVLLFLLPFCTTQNTTCSGLKPYKTVPNSAAGKWYLTRATKFGNSTENKNTCGFFNTVPPCKCIGVNINSPYLPPNIPSYILQNFGYNEKFNAYALTNINISSISNTSSLFNAYVSIAKVNFTIAMLGTDDYLSWITLAMCDVLKDDEGNDVQMKWVITRSPFPTTQTLGNATLALKNASSSSNELVEVNQVKCPQIL